MSMLDDVANYLQTAGVGTLGVNLFQGYTPDMDNVVGVYHTGGPAPDMDLPTHSPTFQVFIRATDYAAGEAKLALVRATLHRLTNTQLGGTYFYYILAQSEGGNIGRNENGQDEFSINFIARSR